METQTLKREQQLQTLRRELTMLKDVITSDRHGSTLYSYACQLSQRLYDQHNSTIPLELMSYIQGCLKHIAIYGHLHFVRDPSVMSMAFLAYWQVCRWEYLICSRLSKHICVKDHDIGTLASLPQDILECIANKIKNI